MKSLSAILGTTALMAMSGAALAADMGRPAAVVPVMPTVLPAYSWAGGYAGLAAGYGRMNTRWDDAGNWFSGDVYRWSTAGLDLGGYAGYNFMLSPNVVAGVEGDISYQFGRGIYAFGASDGLETKPGLSASLRGRLGYAFDRTLVYGTAGLALNNADNHSYVPFGPTWHTDGWQAGYVIGAGVEHALTDRLLLRLEGLYSSYGARNAAPSSNPGGTYIEKVKNDAFVVRAGLAYKF